MEVRRYARVLALSVGVACGLLSLALADDPPKKPAGTGSVRGTLTIDGTADHRKFRIEESVLSLRGEGLAKASAPLPTEPVTMDQQGIAYVPTVLAIVAGTTVEFKNSDPTLHNVHCTCMVNKSRNLAVNPGEKSTVVFEKPELVEISCNIHATMKAWIVVLENSFFAQPAKGGDFKIENVPPGTWEIKAWHDGTTPLVQKVTVTAGEESTVKLDLVTKKRR